MTNGQILDEILQMHADGLRELGVKNAPLVKWDVSADGPCTAWIYWRKGKRPETVWCQSWAELSFAVLLKFEEQLT